MGMARAIGVQRTQLVQMFVTEGVVYDLIAAALGVLLGLGISYAMVGFIGRLFSDITQQISGQSALFQIQFRAAPTSLVIAYCVGVLFTFVVVTIAAWRVSRLNIVSAIRGLPEPDKVGGASRIGRIFNVVSGPIVVILGGVVIYYGISDSFVLILVGLSLILTGISLFLGWWLARTTMREQNVQRVVYSLIGGGLLLLWAIPWDRLLGGVGTEVDLGGPWILLSFILTGPMIILGAILLVMFNADAWTWGITRLLGGIGALTPVLRTAVAYPLSSRFRTGMAMLLFAMIISTVTIMTVVIEATQTIVAPDSERNAGFDISVSSSLLSLFDPLEDLEAEIPDKPDFPVDDVAVVGSVVSAEFDAQQLTNSNEPDSSWRTATLVGANSGYLEQAETVYSFGQRAPGYDTDAAVWQALRERDDVAVITANLVPDTARDREDTSDVAVTPESESVDEGPQRGPGSDDTPWWARRLTLTGFTEQDETLPQIRVALRPLDGGENGDAPAQTIQIIGVIAENTTLAGEGILVPNRVYAAIYEDTVVPDNFYIKIVKGAEVHEVALAVERAFLNNAVNATVMAEAFAQGQAVTRGILQLFQGFLALGLLVGIAALGVISTRTVVERRQQVGMLRAIGFQPRMVALSFLLESSFIALTGILVGTAAGVALGQNMVGLFFESLTGGRTFATPWLQIAGIVLAAYLFSLLTTILPAYQASRIYPAEALRYE